jgi:putative spermidine/putrescine transport system ATP-binding protein
VENQTLHILPAQNLHDGDRVLVIVRPEEISIQETSEGVDYYANGAGNHIAGIIELRTFLGPFTRFHVRINESTTLTSDIPSQQARDYYVAQHVVLSFPPNACQVLPLDKDAVELAQLAEAEEAEKV